MKNVQLSGLFHHVIRMLRGKQEPGPEGMNLHFSNGAKIRDDNVRRIAELEQLPAHPRQAKSETPPSSGSRRPLQLQHLALDPELPG